IAVEGANGQNDATSYEALASQVDALLRNLVDSANTQMPDGQYLFGGTASRAAPFSVTASDAQGRPPSIAYDGAAEGASTPVSQQQNVPTFYAGSTVFQSRQRGTTAFLGNTGAAAGTGTDSATGRGTLLVTHTATSYGGASGVQAGSGSVTGDSILGPSG